MYNAGGDDLNVAFLDKDLNAHRNLLHRNCDSVLQAAYRFGGPMVARGRGAVVLVTSGAAWAGAATLATYSATKAFDLILAEASGRSGATAGSTCSGSSSAGPTWIYGSQNPTGGSPFGAMSRRDAVLLMSRGATHRNNDPSQPSTL